MTTAGDLLASKQKPAMCRRCRKNVGHHEWTVAPCAKPGPEIKAMLCHDCDVDLNDMMLSWFRVKGKMKLIEAYREKVFSHDGSN